MFLTNSSDKTGNLRLQMLLEVLPSLLFFFPHGIPNMRYEGKLMRLLPHGPAEFAPAGMLVCRAGYVL